MVFPTFFNLSLNLAIRVPDLSHSHLLVYFCWLYRASPSLAAKNIINLILVLTIWWCPCVESSLVLLEEGVAMTSAFSWQNSISLCPASFLVWATREAQKGMLWLHGPGSPQQILRFLHLPGGSLSYSPDEVAGNLRLCNFWRQQGERKDKCYSFTYKGIIYQIAVSYN